MVASVKETETKTNKKKPLNTQANIYDGCEGFMVHVQCVYLLLFRVGEVFQAERRKRLAHGGGRADPSCQDGMITFFLAPTW